MSEIADNRPVTGSSRGRTATRGSRGGSRANYRAVNGNAKEPRQSTATEDQGELGQLKQKYATELLTLKDMFPAWSDIDLAMALNEDEGDLTRTINRMAEGITTLAILASLICALLTLSRSSAAI